MATLSTVRVSGRSSRLPLMAAIAFVPLITSAAFAQTSPITTGSQSIRLQPFATVPSADGAPQDLVPANDGSGRLFATTRGGKVRVMDGNTGAFLDSSATPYLSLASAGINLFTGGEGGFSGIAFSPTFATDHKFFTVNTDVYNAANTPNFSHPELAPTTGVTPANQIVLRQWTASSSTSNNPTFTSSVVMRINHPQDNHQGGALKFGPDGDLYLSLGDGGGGNDNNGGANNNTDGHTNATGNAQDTSVVFGKILRVKPNYSGGYTIPADNPFASSPTAVKEIFAYGLRNSYRMSFDRGTGKLYAGDVGQGNREEVDIITNGGNYGWVYKEGTRDNQSDSGRTAPAGFTSIAPIAEYTHGDGDSIIGGFVYRGTAIPALQGKYIFGDYQGTGNVGRLFYTDGTGGPIQQFQYSTVGGAIVPSVPLYGFGEGEGGELYALFVNGQIVHIIPEPTSVALVGMTTVLFRRLRR